MVTVSNFSYERKFIDDEFNYNNYRTQDNTRCGAYNCGGFALGTFSWYAPYNDDILRYALTEGLITSDQVSYIRENTTEADYNNELEDYLYDWEKSGGVPQNSLHGFPTYECWKSMENVNFLERINVNVFTENSRFMDYFTATMLKEITNLRLINSLNEIKENEYCIAFRVGYGDFHYIRSNNYKCDTWIGKLGSNPINELGSPVLFKKGSEVYFNVLFGRRYNSNTILFAKERDKNYGLY